MFSLHAAAEIPLLLLFIYSRWRTMEIIYYNTHEVAFLDQYLLNTDFCVYMLSEAGDFLFLDLLYVLFQISKNRAKKIQ